MYKCNPSLLPKYNVYSSSLDIKSKLLDSRAIDICKSGFIKHIITKELI